MAVGDTYLVGAEVAKVLTDLHTHQSLNYSRVHLIGHSLGAQIAGHIGYRVKGIGRITGKTCLYVIVWLRLRRVVNSPLSYLRLA